MKKNVSFVWDGTCQKAFKDIKEYLTNPLFLVAPILGKTFLLYVRAINHFLGALLTQKNDEGFEQAIRYMRWTLAGAECRYNPVKKECLALVFAVQKTRQYLVGQEIHVISRVNLLRILMTKSRSLTSD